MMERLEKFIQRLSYWLFWIGGVALVGMLALTVGDIIGIKLLSRPIPGGIEMVAFLGAVVTAFAIAHTQVLRGHIQVEFVVMHVPQRLQAVLAALTSLLSLIFFSLLAWRSYDFGRVLQVTGEVSMTQKIPIHPFVYGIAFCSVVVSLLLLTEFLRALVEAVKK